MLTDLSSQLADAVDRVAPSVVQVQGHRRPVSGSVYAESVVITTARALGREDGLQVRSADQELLQAELVGWDPATNLAVLRVPGLKAPPLALAAGPVRVGHLALAVGRSWSNAVTASAGIVSVIGGPLRTGYGRAIDQVIRTTAPMHDGFAGGAFIDTSGGLVGIATAASIRGLGVIIPAAIAWKAAAHVLEHGRPRRGYLGIAGQPVTLPERQRVGGASSAVLVAAVTEGSPADAAGVLVGDVLLSINDRTTETPDDLLDALYRADIGRPALLRLLRGGSIGETMVTIAARRSST
jgi:serine protease Do